MNKTPPVIVVRGSDICFLGILRSCRAANIPVIAITFTWPGAPVWHSELSECLGERYEIANPFTDADLAASQLADIFAALFNQWQQRLMVLPSSDTNYMFLLDHYERFANSICLMGDRAFDQPRYDVIHKASCAELLLQRAPEFVPITLRCSSVTDIDSAVDNMLYPAVYKPAVKDYGQTFYTKHNGNKAIEVAGPDELRAALLKEIEDGFDLVVQEKIFFDSVYDEIPFYLYADAKGEIRMAANGIKELIDPFPFGTAIILRMAWFPELLEAAKQVVEALQYRGILMIEFVKDKKDGRWKVIEVNPRHWLFNGFYQRQGLNFTECLYKDMYGDASKDTGSNMMTPATAIQAKLKDSVHFDLQAVASNWFDDPQHHSLTEFIKRIDEFDGNISSAFYDLADPAPGRQRLETMAEKFGWDNKDLKKLIDLLV